MTGEIEWKKPMTLGETPPPAGTVSKQSECRSGPLKPRGLGEALPSMSTFRHLKTVGSVWQEPCLVFFLRLWLTVAGQQAQGRASPPLTTAGVQISQASLTVSHRKSHSHYVISSNQHTQALRGVRRKLVPPHLPRKFALCRLLVPSTRHS